MSHFDNGNNEQFLGLVRNGWEIVSMRHTLEHIMDEIINIVGGYSDIRYLATAYDDAENLVGDGNDMITSIIAVSPEGVKKLDLWYMTKGIQAREK